MNSQVWAVFLVLFVYEQSDVSNILSAMCVEQSGVSSILSVICVWQNSQVWAISSAVCNRCGVWAAVPVHRGRRIRRLEWSLPRRSWARRSPRACSGTWRARGTARRPAAPPASPLHTHALYTHSTILTRDLWYWHELPDNTVTGLFWETFCLWQFLLYSRIY